MSTFLDRLVRRRRPGRHSAAAVQARLRDTDSGALPSRRDTDTAAATDVDYRSGVFRVIDGRYERINLPPLPLRLWVEDTQEQQ